MGESIRKDVRLEACKETRAYLIELSQMESYSAKQRKEFVKAVNNIDWLMERWEESLLRMADAYRYCTYLCDEVIALRRKYNG